jgi:signal transduction histidine kinase
MGEILYAGLHEATLALLKANLNTFSWIAINEADVKTHVSILADKAALLVGEEVNNPVRVAQEAFAKDKSISVLLINDKQNHHKVKQALQFASFVGPTIKAISNELGTGMVPVIEDAMQRTEQRRSYVKIKSVGLPITAFAPNQMEKVRVNYMTRVLDEAPIGAALLGKDGSVLNVNAYITRLLNLTDKEILGIPFTAHFAGEERAALHDFITDGYHNKDKRTFKLFQGESPKFLEISIGDIDASNNSPYKIAIVNDVTAATEAQQHTMTHLQELQKLNDELRKVNQDLDTFVYTASHDLKSPILNIEGLVDLLEEGLSPEHAAMMPELQHIRLSVERFKHTIEDLTEVARIQRNFEKESTELDIRKLVDDVVQLLNKEIEEAGATIVLHLDAAPTFMFSRKNFKSVLLNLVGNAIKYRSPERAAQVVVTTAIQHGNFYLSVQDNGLGLPNGSQNKIFQLFKRMHVHVKGSGVGLYIVKRIVENSGGTITVTSEEGVGTTFHLSLPIVQHA